MSDRDAIDKRRALRFAWRRFDPQEPEQAARTLDDTETIPAREAASAPVPEPDAPAEPTRPRPGEASTAAPRRPGERCGELAVAVDRVWDLASPDLQAKATAHVVQQAERLSLGLVGMRAYPVQSMRLWRLYVRHHGALPAQLRRDAPLFLAWADVSHPSVVDLLVEIALLGDRILAQHMWLPLQRAAHNDIDHDALAHRLGAILEDPQTSWPQREIAGWWLAGAETRAAVPYLRHALRLPHLRIRGDALAALLQAEQALLPEDLLWFLDELVDHPVPGLLYADYNQLEPYYRLADDLLLAVERLHPPGGAERLLRFYEACHSWRRYENAIGLDDDFALRALAAAYPDRALPLIEQAFQSTLRYRRQHGLQAAAKLPAPAAREYLLRAYGDGACEMAENAADLWLERFGTPMPREALAGVPVQLCCAPPSPRLHEWLLTLRSGTRETRKAMVLALLGEAPDPEALAAILFALDGDEFFSGPAKPAEGTVEASLPKETQWGPALYRAFGAVAIDGLFWMVRRRPLWWPPSAIELLRELVTSGALTPAEQARVRDFIEALLPEVSGDDVRPRTLHWLLGKTGVSQALLGQWRHQLMHGDPAAAGVAAECLGRLPDAAEAFQEALLARMQDAVETDQADLHETLFYCAARYAAPRVEALAEEILAAYPRSGRAVPTRGAASQAARMLHRSGRRDEAWVTQALEQPESPWFLVGCDVAYRNDPLPLAWQQALERVLESRAGTGDVAAAAALVLLYTQCLPADDARLPAIVDGASPMRAADLLNMIHLRGGTAAPYFTTITRLVFESDDWVLEPVRMVVRELDSPAQRQQWKKLLPQLKDPYLIEQVRVILDLPRYDDSYWIDVVDPSPSEEEALEADLDDELLDAAARSQN